MAGNLAAGVARVEGGRAVTAAVVGWAVVTEAGRAEGWRAEGRAAARAEEAGD